MEQRDNGWPEGPVGRGGAGLWDRGFTAGARLFLALGEGGGRTRCLPGVLVLIWLLLPSRLGAVEARWPGSFRVMTYNVENYLLTPTATRRVKSAESRAKVAESIVAGSPDILALQEIGEVAALRELQSRLRSRGLDLPHWEHVRGWDTNIFTAVLSRFPIVRRASHTNESFLLNGRRWHVSRGIAEVEIAVTPAYRMTLWVAHLKSRRAIGEADERDVREGEAAVLREFVEKSLRARPDANVVVCGDFNDTRDSVAIRTLLGGREFRLFDPRPAEANGDAAPAENPRFEPRRVTWTHYYGREDSYSRVDYLLMSRGLQREWRAEGSRVVVVPDWGQGSDHRPIVGEFWSVDR